METTLTRNLSFLERSLIKHFLIDIDFFSISGKNVHLKVDLMLEVVQQDLESVVHVSFDTIAIFH